MKDRWATRWKVAGSNGHEWTVALAHDGSWGCSCPVWKFKRQECHHIAYVKQNRPTPGQPQKRPDYILAAVEEIKLEDGKLLVPLVCVGNTHQEAAVCNALLENGYSMGEVRELRHIPREWTARAIRTYIAEHGEPAFPSLARRSSS